MYHWTLWFRGRCVRTVLRNISLDLRNVNSKAAINIWQYTSIKWLRQNSNTMHQNVPMQQSRYVYNLVTQPVARGQHVVRDKMLFCPRRRLFPENTLSPFPGEAEIERRSNFEKKLWAACIASLIYCLKICKKKWHPSAGLNWFFVVRIFPLHWCIEKYTIDKHTILRPLHGAESFLNSWLACS